MEIEGGFEDEIEEILKQRIKNEQIQYLVKWKEVEEPTWENEDDILDDYALLIKNFLSKQRKNQKEKEKEKQEKMNQHTNYKSPATYSQAKLPRFIRENGKIISAKTKRKIEASRKNLDIVSLFNDLLQKLTGTCLVFQCVIFSTSGSCSCQK